MKLYIIAGANGSGKTTFAKSFSKKSGYYFINADEIAKELDSNNLTKHKVKAGRIFFQELEKRLDDRESFVVETTLSGKYLVKYINRAKENGFEVILIYLFLENPMMNISRVNSRVLAGGHNVPKDDIIRRFYRSHELFLNLYREMVDSWTIYHNTDEVFEKIATDVVVYDKDKYQKFIKGLSS